MLDAVLWAAIAAASLVVGALVAFIRPVSDRVLGLVLAFGAGVLISAVAYELVEDAVEDGLRSPLIAVGFALGAVAFYLGSLALERRGGSRSDGDGNAVVLGAVLDGIPESVVLGLSLVGGAGISVPFLAAVFISNVPESLGASADLLRSGTSRTRIVLMWTAVVVASGLSAGLGYGLLSGAPREVVAAVQTFAAGAIIAMLAESMMPEALAKGGRAVGLATAFGFAMSALLTFSS